jgi:hypothetical protein
MGVVALIGIGSDERRTIGGAILGGVGVGTIWLGALYAVIKFIKKLGVTGNNFSTFATNNGWSYLGRRPLSGDAYLGPLGIADQYTLIQFSVQGSYGDVKFCFAELLNSMRGGVPGVYNMPAVATVLQIGGLHPELAEDENHQILLGDTYTTILRVGYIQTREDAERIFGYLSATSTG